MFDSSIFIELNSRKTKKKREMKLSSGNKENEEKNIRISLLKWNCKRQIKRGKNT